jgi:hypothetical protein
MLFLPDQSPSREDPKRFPGFQFISMGPDPEDPVSSASDIRIDAHHARAICAEVGERLRFSKDESATLSPRLCELMKQLREFDRHDVPSIVPEADEYP